MKITVQVVIEGDQEPGAPVQLACFERETLTEANLGLTLTEAKDLLMALQESLVTQQTKDYVAEQQCCPACGAVRPRKGQHQLVMRTLFGTFHLPSPRFYTCDCQVAPTQSVSPLAELLPERTTPELLYLQTKWAALMSYGLTIDLLGEVLPLDLSETSLRRQVRAVAQRCEDELGEEQPMFIEGCPQTWAELPIPEAPLTLGLDGGYVQARQDNDRKAGSFEVIVGKSLSADRPDKCLGFVNGYDVKPRRRVFEHLKAQGLQMNQTVTFMSDGGDTVRDLQYYLSPNAEHLLDWFHVTMRLTVMQQMVKGLPNALLLQNTLLDPAHSLERVKWFLWHGNVFSALQIVDDLVMDLEIFDSSDSSKLLKTLREFAGYIRANRSFIPNYGDRYRYGELISTSFVESTVNHVLSKRFVKKQQMRWTREGVHLLLQVRLQVLNQEWRPTFERWYPGLKIDPEIETLVA